MKGLVISPKDGRATLSRARLQNTLVAISFFFFLLFFKVSSLFYTALVVAVAVATVAAGVSLVANFTRNVQLPF